MILVTGLSLRTAHALQASGFERLIEQLRRHRLMVQGMGIVFIFLTAFWGMFVNIRGGVLLGP